MTPSEQDNLPKHTQSQQTAPHGRLNLHAGRDVDVEIGRDMVAGDQIQGTKYQIGTVVINTLTEQTLTPQQRQTQTVRHNLIQNVHATWIQGVLHASLHTAVMLELDKSYQRNAVNRMWGLYDQQQAAAVPEEKPLSQLFNEAQRKLLILGEPGGGKTITLLQLAEELLNEAAQTPTAPVPVVLNLSSWGAHGGDLLSWLIDELNLQTGLAKAVTEQWLKIGQLILLLDGLDEVAAEQRDECVTAINTFMKAVQAELVVCSRIKDYEALNSKLNLQNAIKINPLGRAKIDAYLATPDLQLAAVRTIIPNDPVLLELAQTPLMLSIMTLAYRGMTAAELNSPLSPQERQEQLYTNYIRAMFGRRPLSADTPYNQKQAQNWLIELAHGMFTHNQQVFYIEQLQPSWLKPTPKRNHRWLLMLIFGLLTGLIIGSTAALIIELSGGLQIDLLNGASYHLQHGLPFGLYLGLVSAAVVGLLSRFTLEFQITLLESLTWSSLTFKKIGRAVKTGLIFGLPVGLFAIFLTTPLRAFACGLFFALLGFFLGERFAKELSAVLPISLNHKKYSGIFDLIIEPSAPPPSSRPNQGIWSSVTNARTFGVTVGLIAGPPTGLTFALATDALSISLTYTLLSGLISGLIIGPIIGFIYYGGFITIQHYLLRWQLSRQQLFPPLARSLRHPDYHLVSFLDTMRDRILLRRVGGGWIFIHRTLLEHFAAQHPNAKEGIMKDEV